MQQQNEGNNAATPNWIVLHEMLNLSHRETMYLSAVIKGIGERDLLALMNTKLNNPRFEVQFDFEQTEKTLIKGEYQDLALFHHDLTIPKPTRVLATTAAIKEAFDVTQVREDELTITYTVYLGEGPYANTIDETVFNINCILGPVVEEGMKDCKLIDYHMTFNIGLMY